jgi:hypothetical protein
MSNSGGQPRAIPLLALPLAGLVVLLLAFGVVRATLVARGTDAVVVAKSATAGQRLERDDLRVEKVDGYTVDDTVVTKVDDALGHLALGGLAEGGTPSVRPTSRTWRRRRTWRRSGSCASALTT